MTPESWNSEVRGDRLLTGSASANTFPRRQILDKQPVVGRRKHIPVDRRINGVFCGSDGIQRGCQASWNIDYLTEAGSKTSTVTLRVGGDKREPSAWEYNWATLFPDYINTGTWPSRLGESRIWDSRIWSWVPRDSDSRLTAWRWLAAILNDRPIFSSERMLRKNHERKGAVEKILLVVILKGLDAKTNYWG
jgi:hypothetical protein